MKKIIFDINEQNETTKLCFFSVEPFFALAMEIITPNVDEFFRFGVLYQHDKNKNGGLPTTTPFGAFANTFEENPERIGINLEQDMDEDRYISLKIPTKTKCKITIFGKTKQIGQ